MQYRDDMTEAESAQLLAECDELDQAYAAADAAEDAQRQAEDEQLGPEEAQMLRDEAWEASMEYFNRYIAGDR